MHSSIGGVQTTDSHAAHETGSTVLLSSLSLSSVEADPEEPALDLLSVALLPLALDPRLPADAWLPLLPLDPGLPGNA